MLPLLPAAESFRAARSSARAICADHGIAGDRTESVVLVTAELIGNAVRHGAPPLAYEVDLDGADVLVVVQDSDVHSPGDGSAASLDGEGGRGLFIVSQLSRDWGWHLCPGGKQVWARV